MKRLTLGLAVALAIAALGCKKEAAPAAAGDKAVAKKPLKELIAGKKPSLVGPFGKLKFGMKEDEAKAAVPELFVKSYGMRSEEYEGVSFSTYFPKDSGTLETMRVQLPKPGARETLVAAWGPAIDATEYGKAQSYWFNAEDGIRACLKEGFGEDMDLELRAYLPAAKLIGDAKGTFGFETKPLLGATAADLKATFPVAFGSHDEKQAAEERKKIEKLAGQDLGALGKAHASVWLALLPPEWGSSFTRVNVDFDEAGKVNRYRFGVAYELHPAARDEALKLLEVKLGKPKEGEDLGRKVFVYSDSPKIVSGDDDIVHAVEVTVEASSAP